MKSILISIKPKYVADILNGKKTIEIRKTCPEVFKHLKPYEGCSIDVYIYCTKDNHQLVKPKDYDKYLLFTKGAVDYSNEKTLNGKIVAKFTLNKVDKLEKRHLFDAPFLSEYIYRDNETSYSFERKTQLTEEELCKYLKGQNGYAWHISNLVIFDEPKELSEFIQSKRKNYEEPQVQKAPQSWCYVEVEE